MRVQRKCCSLSPTPWVSWGYVAGHLGLLVETVRSAHPETLVRLTASVSGVSTGGQRWGETQSQTKPESLRFCSHRLQWQPPQRGSRPPWQKAIQNPGFPATLCHQSGERPAMWWRRRLGRACFPGVWYVRVKDPSPRGALS